MLKEKLNLLPEEIVYNLPSNASGAWEDKNVGEQITEIWAPEKDCYSLRISKVDGKWEIKYVNYNIYEGYPESFLPVKSDEEIIEELKKNFSNYKEGENIRYLLGFIDMSLDFSSPDLEEVVDKTLEWLKEKGIEF